MTRFDQEGRTGLNRGGFVKNTALGVGACEASADVIVCGNRLRQEAAVIPYGIRNQPKPLAIAMWDYSWILRHHRAGEFEEWYRVPDELQERGYNAIRIDAMPHLIAPDPDGKVIEDSIPACSCPGR